MWFFLLLIKWPIGDVLSSYLVIFPTTLSPFCQSGSHIPCSLPQLRDSFNLLPSLFVVSRCPVFRSRAVYNNPAETHKNQTVRNKWLPGLLPGWNFFTHANSFPSGRILAAIAKAGISVVWTAMIDLSAPWSIIAVTALTSMTAWIFCDWWGAVMWGSSCRRPFSSQEREREGEREREREWERVI